MCFGGSPTRMLKFAYFIAKEINYKLPPGQDFSNIAHGSDRYVLYKIGPVLSVSVSLLLLLPRKSTINFLLAKTSPIAHGSDRYVLYKIAPVLSVIVSWNN